MPSDRPAHRSLCCSPTRCNMTSVHRHWNFRSMLSRRVHGSMRMITFRGVVCNPSQLRSRKPRKLKSVCASTDEDQPDLIERIFGRLFGVKALEERSPGGMKRMSEEALLEQYPATLTEFAAPVSGDDEVMASFRPLLAQTRLQKMPLRCRIVEHFLASYWHCSNLQVISSNKQAGILS